MIDARLISMDRRESLAKYFLIKTSPNSIASGYGEDV